MMVKGGSRLARLPFADTVTGIITVPGMDGR
jgi:hypothetical protein